MKRSTAVVFDFYGTLAEAASWGPSIEEVLVAEGYALPEAVRDSPDWWGTEDGLDHAEHSRDREAYVAWERARLERTARACGVPAERLAAVVEALHRTVKTFELRVFDEVHRTLERLAAAGARLAVCSNWDWDLPDVLDDLGLCFDAVVTSARAGARKPHPRIYEETLSLLDATPADTWFVGDTFGPDVEGPSRLGMRAVHLVRDGDDRALPPLPEGARRLRALDALPRLVSGGSA